MDVMRAGWDSQDAPQVGIFWYDADDGALFGVSSIYAEEAQWVNGRRTVRMLHKQWWQKQRQRRAARGEALGIFAKDYTLTPRGRIFQCDDGHFELMAGDWITEDIVRLVREEFNLQNEDLRVVIDEHWQIGSGWDEG